MSARLMATLEVLASEVEAMSPREWELAKNATYIRPPALLYCLHGTGQPDELIAVGRSYRPLGAGNEFVDYASAEFAHLHCTDSPVLRRLATSINPKGRAAFPYGATVPILVMLSHADTRMLYARRLRSIIEVLRLQGDGQ